jgi:hypothetical protein
LLSSPGPESFARALQALQRQIPILVPEEADELRELCLTSDAGLFYGNSDELRQSLLLLLSNEPLRQGLGRRGRKFLADLVTPGVSEQVP